VSPALRLDLRGLACPFTWVRTRVALERLAAGDALEVWLAPGEPAESVPRSAALDGHLVRAVEPLAGDPTGSRRVVLEKGPDPAARPEEPWRSW
jgi:TusA-related sulfurtransferase